VVWFFFEFGTWPILASAQWMKQAAGDAVDKLGLEPIIATGAYIVVHFLNQVVQAYAQQEKNEARHAGHCPAAAEQRFVVQAAPSSPAAPWYHNRHRRKQAPQHLPAAVRVR
jgi:hypothetical protein